MVALSTDSLLKTNNSEWFWGLMALVISLGVIGIFMLAGVGLYLATMGRPCG